MKKNPIILSVLVFMLLLISYELNAELRSYTPNKLTYTGYLCDDSGNPINNSVNLTFDIYDVPLEGASLWNSSHSNVDISNGFFSVILDNITIFGEDYAILYLQVKVNNEILLPRQEITAVPASVSTTNWDGGIVTNDVTIGEPGAGNNLDVYGDIRIRRSDGGVGAQFTNRSDLVLGGNGSNGDLDIRDSDGNHAFTIDCFSGSSSLTMAQEGGGHARIEMFNQGTRSIYLRSDGDCEIHQDLKVYKDLRVGELGQNYDVDIYDDLTVHDDCDIYGDLDVNGSKNFVHPHPYDPSKQITFTTLEGPENGIYYRGSTQLVNGYTIVKLPEEFYLVAEPGEINVQVTLRGKANGIYVEHANEREFKVIETLEGKSNAQFDYFVTAIRRGFTEHETIGDNVNYRPDSEEEIKSFETRYNLDTEVSKALKLLLIQNGTLNSDGTMNLETAVKLGWFENKNIEIK
jgi:hypothetical protein